MAIILAIIGALLVIIEAMTASTFFIWIALGFFAASLTAIVTENLIIITIVGIIVTVISLSTMRTKYAKFILPKQQTATSYNELIGKHAIMQADYLANGVDVGTARAGGVDWSVQSEQTGKTFNQNERVIIRKIEGARLIIEKEE